MKNKIVMKLFVIGCAVAFSLTGCKNKNTETGDTTVPIVETADTTDEEISDEASTEDIEDEEETSLSAGSTEDVENKESDEETETEDEDGEEANETEDDTEATETTDSSASASTGSNNSSQNSTSNSGNAGSSTGSGTTTTPHTHTYNRGVITKNASCTATGVRTYTCTCGTSYTETIPVTAHSYSNGYCTVCGTADPNAVVTYTYEVYLDTEMFNLVNARRNSLGYGSYTWDSGMDETAKARARQLADNFGHDYTHPYGEFITMVTSAATTNYLHNNYVESVAHDREIHQGTYSYMSSATCVKKDNRGNIIATYNIIVTRSEQAPGASWTPGGEPDPNPPAPEDIIW